MSNDPNTIIEEDKKEAMEEMEIWQCEELIKRLPEAELRQMYELVDDLLINKYGVRLHE